MKYLLDTMVLSEPTRPQPNQAVLDWLEQRDISALHVSVISVGEVARGISELQASARRDFLQNWLDEQLLQRFLGRVLPIDAEVAITWGRISGDLRRRGIALPVLDGLIASTAIVHRLTLVTRNVKDFECSGAPIFNPWE